MTLSEKLTFRNLQGESDFPLMLALAVASDLGDQIHDTFSLDDLRNWCAPSPRFDPSADLLFAMAQNDGGESTVIGFSRVSWYTGAEDTRLYSQYSVLHPDWRKPGIWPAMVRQNDHRLREIAAGHPDVSRRALQGWATATQTQWIAALESTGYRAVRHFNNMLHSLTDIPDRALPDGLEIRPVQPEHYRQIWETQREVQPELFETGVEAWTEEKYQPWVENSSHTPHLWQVAWDGDQVAGMVLSRIDEAANAERERKRGCTEHIFVRKPWRNRGLAGALVARSLQLLKAQGMDEVELGVDTENASGAYRFYQKMGYQTFSTDIWFRKPLEETL